MLVIGIDPGSRATGYGLVEYKNKILTHKDHGVIHSNHANLMQRLANIHLELKKVIDLYQPQQLAIEQVFVHINPQSALKLGQARGAALSASIQTSMSYHEYSPRAIKKAITGYGAAQKGQMQQMIKLLLKLTELPATDAADALGIAICHCHHQQLAHTLSKATQN